MAIISNNMSPFGCVKPLPLKLFPEGKARIRIRHDYFPIVRIKTKDGIREFYVEEKDGKWIPYSEKGRNQTI